MSLIPSQVLLYGRGLPPRTKKLESAVQRRDSLSDTNDSIKPQPAPLVPEKSISQVSPRTRLLVRKE